MAVEFTNFNMNVHVPKINRPAPPSPKYKQANYDLPVVCHRYKLGESAPSNRMAVEGIMLEKASEISDSWVYMGNEISTLAPHIESGLVVHEQYNTQTKTVIK